MKFRHLLAPVMINKVEIKNRIFRPGHGTYFGRGVINDTLIAYHEARARAGVGLSTLEVVHVHPSSSANPTVYGWDDSVIPGFRRISAASHRYGMKLFTQVWHGGQHWPSIEGAPPWAPSDLPSPWGVVPVPMSRDQIDEIVLAFAATCRRAQEGGLDGVELHFGHGYLVHNFLSPITNTRTDEYGGSLENRMRFGRECLRAVRRAVGRDFAVGIRISDQHSPGGVTPGECAEIVRSYCDEGVLDFVNGSMGSYHDTPSMLPAMDTPTGAMLPSSAEIIAAAKGKKAASGTGVVRMTVGRYRTLDDADQAIREDIADMIGIQRAMIADADLVEKALTGESERIRPCIGCNQGCIGGILSAAKRMSCTVNPAVGYEATLSEGLIVKVTEPKRILVVGGGPAGMEAARLAALSGHTVTLTEAQPRLGGAVNIAKKSPKSAQIGDITAWLEQEIYRLGVDVRLSTYTEADDVRAMNPDAVIVATGSTPRMDGIQTAIPGRPASGIGQPHVYSSHDIYDVTQEKLGRHAVLFDDVGHYEALGIAEYLIAKGVAVTFVTRMTSLAPHIDAVQRLEPVLRRLRLGDFNLRVRGRIDSIGLDSCVLGWLDGEQLETVPADVVVMVTYNSANAELYRELGGQMNAPSDCPVRIVGDAVAPRDLLIAIREGHMTGRFIDEAIRQGKEKHVNVAAVA
jgi:2,4-dienoyl-CoA reductase-like NADH-dependent reductase (Old Yellow Enzyme family)